MKKFFYKEFEGADHCAKCPNCGSDCIEDGLKYKTKFLFPYSLFNHIYKWLQSIFWQFRHFVPWPLKNIPHSYVINLLLCENCKTKSIVPKNEKKWFSIKSKAKDDQKKESPTWVDERGFLKCPNCNSYNVRNHWAPAGFTAYDVYLKCYDCKNDDKEHSHHVSSGL